jgi:hypothetical protein
MTDNRRLRRFLDRLRDRTDVAAPEAEAAPEPVADAVSAAEPVAEVAPEPPRREHLFGSQYRVRMSFADVMATRGYTGEQVLRRLAAPSDSQRQRDAAARRAGYKPGEVMWPSE